MELILKKQNCLTPTYKYSNAVFWNVLDKESWIRKKNRIKWIKKI